MDIRQVIKDGPMSRYQVVCVAICVALNMIDGFDVLVMAFTAPFVSAEWGLKGAELGYLLSAGLFGMAGGSLFLAPWADRFGRRPIILFCLCLLSAGMALSGAARGTVELAAFRVLTGIGIGGMLASLNVITSEYSSDKWRSTAVSIQVVGYPIGATVGGSIAAILIAKFGWPAAFYFGAVTSLLMVPWVVWYMPESPDFLLAKRPAHALKSLNALLRGMGRESLAQLPEAIAGEQRAAQGNPVSRLFHGGLARSTVLIWTSYFLLMFAFYFVLSWTPKLLVTAGLSKQQGITGGVLLNVGGIVGGIVFGYLASRLQVRRLTGVYLVITAITLVLFGVAGSQLNTAFPIALLIGAFIFGSMAGLYALAPTLYPPAMRTTGMGWAIGIGRIGAILAPSIVGLMIDGGWQAHDLYFVFTLPLLAAALIVFALRS